MLDVNIATAETTAVYRGFDLNITVKKYEIGLRKVIVSPRNVSTSLRPDLANRDGNEKISTSHSSFEAVSANLALDRNEFSSIKTVVKGRQTLFDELLRRGPLRFPRLWLGRWINQRRLLTTISRNGRHYQLMQQK